MGSGTRPLSFASLVLFESLLSVSLAIPRFRYRGVILFSLLLALYCRILLSTTGDPGTDWSLGLSLTPQLGKAFDLLLLVDAEKTVKKNGDSTGDDSASFSLWRKLGWSLEAVHTPRGVGWDWEIPYVCYSGCKKRRDFIRSRFIRVVFYYLQLDILQYVMNRYPIADTLPAGEQFSVPALVPAWSYAVAMYLQLWMVHTVPALLIVSLGLGDPGSFPYVMGPVGYMDSLRGVWGRTWHQSGRRVINTVGLSLRDNVFHALKGSRASNYIQLSIGFALGGATHAIAGWMGGDRIHIRDDTGAAAFFTMQLIGVVLEDLAFETLLRSGVLTQDWRRGSVHGKKEDYGLQKGQWQLDSLSHVLGYAWTVAWLSLTLPAYVNGLSRTGVVSETFVPFSVVSWAVELCSDVT